VFRLDQESAPHRTRLTISGEISAACIEVLENRCERALAAGEDVDLILDATQIDEDGAALLRRLADKGVRLYAKGVYHSYLIDTIWHAAQRGSDARVGTTRAHPPSDGVCQQ
jgi:hypothetical protein